jgi:hypothetical protein
LHPRIEARDIDDDPLVRAVALSSRASTLNVSVRPSIPTSSAVARTRMPIGVAAK